MSDTPSIIIWVISETLTDGSKVYDVELPGGFRVHAVDLDAALAMAEDIVSAINEHASAQTAGVLES